MIFFTDRDLGSLFPKILLDAGIQVETYKDHFKDNDMLVVTNGVLSQKIETFLEKHNPPFIAKVYRPSAKELQGRNKAGRVELWYSPQ